MPSSKARIIDQALTASFANSNPPVLWRLDLEKNHSFAMAIQGRDGDWELGVMSPRGDFTVVARFATREEVDAAFKVVNHAVYCAPSRLKNRVASAFWIAVIIVVAIIAGLLVLDRIPARGSAMANAGRPAVVDVTPPSAPAPIQSGIPLPADDVLKAP